ncbi:MAG: TonB-dependent receptor, partial [Acidobacteria bacterium]|nr:TonB-dependent receptor [Acidobacteriota bacterium]
MRDIDAQSVVGGATQIFSDSLANEIRAGYTQNEYNQRSSASRSYYEEFGIKGVPPFEGLTGLPAIAQPGVTGLGDNNLTPDKRQAQVIQIGDNLSWIHGRHSSKFGAEAWFRRRFHRALGGARGVFNFNGRFTSRTGQQASPVNEGSSFGDLLLGQTNSTRLSTTGTANFRDRYYGFYGTDTWKFSPRLTLNVGLRYELHTPVWEADDRMSFFDFDRTSPTFGTLVLAAGGSLRSRTFSNLDTNNFAPRIGFAYQINLRAVIRGGFGIFYGSRGFENIIESGAINPPYTIDRMVTTPNNVPVATTALADGFPDGWLDPANVLNPTVYTQPADFPWPEVYQWNLNVQRELPGGVVLSLAYVGSSAAHLNGQTDINQPPPGSGNHNLRRPFPSFGTIKLQSDFAHSTYHA